MNYVCAARSIWGAYGYSFQANDMLWLDLDKHKDQQREAGRTLMSSLKRDLFFFDKIYVPGQEYTTLCSHLDSSEADLLQTLRDQKFIELVDLGDLIDTRVETIVAEGEQQELLVTEFLSKDAFNLQRKTEQSFDQLTEVQYCLGKIRTGSYVVGTELRVEERQKLLDELKSMGTEKASEEYFLLGEVVHDYQTRMYSQLLYDKLSLRATPILNNPIQHSRIINTEEKKASKDDVLHILLNQVPIPDDSISWEELFEYRSDEESRRKFVALKQWINKIAKSDVVVGELADEIEYILNEYQAHMKLHRMKVNTGTLETVLLVSAEVVENIAKLKLSSAMKSFLALRRRKIALLEAEKAAPGRELAYIADTVNFVNARSNKSLQRRDVDDW